MKAAKRSAVQRKPAAGQRAKIAVVGPGAIGCLLAARLVEDGHKVILLDNAPRRAKVIAKRGIVVQSRGRTRTIPISVTADPTKSGHVDILFLCVKAYSTASAIVHVSPVIGPDTVVVSMQNGHGNAAKIARVVDMHQIVCGVTGHGVTTPEAGRIVLGGEGKTLVAACIPSERGNAERVAAILTRAGIQTDVMDDAQSLVWSKIVVNAAINPLTAILDVPNGKLLQDREACGQMRKAAQEAAAVARLNGVSLMFADEIAEVEAVCRATRNNISSMLQDIRRGHRTELELITGAVIKYAEKTGIEVPVNRSLFNRMVEVEKTSRRTAWRRTVAPF